MKFSTILTTASVSLGLASAQTSTPYTDANTGITFQAFNQNGYTFGVALPTTPSTDFIGLLAGTGKGWAGVSLGGAMKNNLLIAAWPNAQTVVSSFRKVAAYAPPPEVTGTYSISPIAKGTFVNSTGYQITFVCKACIQTDGTTFAATDATHVLGWALSTAAPAKPATHSTALNKHQTQGNYGMDLASAKSAQYATWAALATPASANHTLTAVEFMA